MGLPYRLVLTSACLVLAARYAFDPTRDARSRCVIAIATGASFSFPDSLGWYITGVLTQLAVSLFVLLRLANSSG